MGNTVPGRHIRGVTDQPDFDLAAWPTPDTGALSKDALRAYLDRKRAVEMCIAGASQKAIKRACGIGLKQATRLIRERCNTPHSDGRIYGFRALIKGMRLRAPSRTKPVVIDEFGRGGMGAMTSLLENDPEFKRKLDVKILKSSPGSELSEVKKPRASLWGWFLTELRARGYEIRKEWPFNSESLGYGALRNYTDRVLAANPKTLARQQGGEKAEKKLLAGDGVDRPISRVFQRVEMDAHKTDGRFCVLMPDGSGGWVPRIIHRLWVIVILEVISRAVLGYFLSMRREVNKQDVLSAIKVALTNWQPRPVMYSNTSLIEGAGLPSVLGEEFVGVCWDETSVDGALAETCKTVEHKLKDVVGSKLVDPKSGFSSRRSLDDRPFIETFFRTLGSRGLQRLSNTTASEPKKKRVNNPDDIALNSQLQYQYLEELLQSMICNYNATRHSSLAFKTPLEMLQHYKDINKFPNRRADNDLVQGLLSTRKLCTVRGGAKIGRKPYVNFSNGHYSGADIEYREDLVGKSVWIINHIENDARIVKCTDLNGQLIGYLRVAPPWHKIPHSLAVRGSIVSLQTAKKILALGSDAILTFLNFAINQKNKKLPVHPAYLELLQILNTKQDAFEGDGAYARAMSKIKDDSAKSVEVKGREQNRTDQDSRRKEGQKNAAASEVDQRPLPARRMAVDKE